MKNRKPTVGELQKRIGELEAKLSEYKIRSDHYSINENNFSNFFNSIKDFIFILNEKAQIIYVNDYVVKRLGYTQDELKGMSVLHVHPPERREEASRIVAEMLAGKSIFCPIPLLAKSGEYVPVETRVAIGLWNDDNVIFGVSKDISELKLSEEKFSKAFMDNSNLMAISVFDTGEYIDVNNKFLDTFKIAREDVIGKTSIELQLFDAESREKLKQILLSGRSVANLEMEVRAKNIVLYGIFSADTIYIQDKKCLLTVVQDISELKNVQYELTESETRLRLALEGAKEGTWDWNVETGTVIFNDYWAEMLEYKLEEIEPNIKTWEKLVHPDDMPEVMIVLNRHLNGETEHFECKHRVKTKSGRWKWILNHGKVIERDDRGKALRAIGTHVDIDDLLRAQEDLMKLNHQLKQLNDTKDKLFSIIAHDLRNPFITILNSAELIVENIQNKETGNTEYLARDMHAQASNTLTLLDNLLNWMKSQTGKLHFNPGELQFSQVIHQIFNIFNTTAGNKNISLNYNESSDVLVYADRNMLETILRNLISNAIKFSYPGGKIDVFSGIEQNDVKIIVSDNGAGMHEETMKKLFRMDTHYTSPGTLEEKGSGMGLILSKEFVMKHGGNIWVESEPGKGSCFIFTLPLKKET